MDPQRGKGDDRSFDLAVRVRLKVAGETLERTFATHLKIRRSLCDVCSRRAGSYFEAIVQVRGFEGPLDKEHQERIRAAVEEAVGRLSEKEREVFLTKSEEVKGGLDFYLSSTSAAQRIAASLRDDLGATLLRSGKIGGVKDGNELQRTTFSVRLPKFIRHDVLAHAERLYRVAKVHPKSIVVTDLESGVQENKADEWIKRASVPGREAVLQDAVVVSVGREELQVLDPANFATVTLANWPRHEPGTEKVPVVRYRGRLYLAG
jgi:nonsense-mediated mRNA decay protein 3